jgi:Domain of unknown function (DUF4347)
MAKLLIYDERLYGSPPWQEVSATCLVNQKHSITSVIDWLKGKCAKYKGTETIYIMAHGDEGWIQLGKEGVHKDNAHLWAPLNYKVGNIIILACNVVKGAKGYTLCSRLAWYTSSYVTAADSTQLYIALPLGVLPTSFGSWEGRVHTWDPWGNWHSSYEEPPMDYSGVLK